MSVQPTIAIAIITFKRPDSFAHTLQSLQKITLPAQTDVRLIVIDNDAEKSALSVINAIKDELSFPVEYMVEERRGIPHARNAALRAAANSDYLAFIDDDDIADSQWLLALYNALRQYNADVVKGPVHYSFPPGKNHLRTLDIFVTPTAKTGSELDSAWTNNVLFSTRIYKENSLCFDVAFLQTGGSDHHFFCGAKRKGAKIIMCQEAIIRSLVPVKRCHWRYLAIRHMRIGATLTISDIRQKGHFHGLRQVVWALKDSTPYAFRLMRGAFKGHTPMIHPVMVVIFMFGRVSGLCHLSPREYK